jgi:hypothetical protein
MTSSVQEVEPKFGKDSFHVGLEVVSKLWCTYFVPNLELYQNLHVKFIYCEFF